MTHLPNGRQRSPHLRLSPAEVKGLWESGYYTPTGYLYHLILSHRKPGWTWKIDNVSQFCKDWGIARSTFYKAKSALVADGVIAEKIIGSVELTVISTNECTQLETPVSDPGLIVSNGGQGVSDPGLSVSDGRHLTLKSIDIQSVCDSTPLNNFKTPTSQHVCVSENQKINVKNPEVRTGVSVLDQPFAQVKNAGSPNEPISPDEETYAPPILLAAKKKFQINLADLHLRRAIERWPERVEVAIACLTEKEITVKHPTRFLQKAIEEQWQPEALAKERAPDEFQEWFEEARQRGLVVGSQRIGGTLMVYTVDERCVPFTQLRQQSWEALAVQLHTVAADTPRVDTAPPEQISTPSPEPDAAALLEAEWALTASPPGDAADDIRQAG